MHPSDISEHIKALRLKFSELEKTLSDPDLYSDQIKSRKVSREHRKLSNLFKKFDRWKIVLSELEDNKNMLHNEEDEDLKEFIHSDIEKLDRESEKLENDIIISLLPPDPNEGKNTIVEIRPAAGGDESSIFAADMFRAYSKYAERKSWKEEVLETNASDLGGIKSVVFSLSGDDVFEKMKYESGVHRVQRIPTTESGGRIHTSTITVAVYPEAEEVELDIKAEDLKIDVFKASGPGGQSVNTTDSAVRITHQPTELTVSSQQEKSQHRNKEIAMRILRARILEKIQAEEAAKQAASKKAQVGTGDRSERIRTYNYPQNRITDHRFNVSVHNLPELLEGNFDLILNEIIRIDCERQLENLST